MYECVRPITRIYTESPKSETALAVRADIINMGLLCECLLGTPQLTGGSEFCRTNRSLALTLFEEPDWSPYRFLFYLYIFVVAGCI